MMRQMPQGGRPNPWTMPQGMSSGGSGFGGQMLRPQMTVGGMPPAGWQKSPQMNPYQGPGYRPNSINLNNLPNRQPGFGMQNQSLFGQYGPRPL